MAGLQTNIYVALMITWVAALVVLILRVIARRMTKQRWWVDDYFCLAAFAFASAGNSIVIIWAAHWYLGQAIHPSFTKEQRENVNVKARLLMFCSEYCYAFSLACTKFTILTLYWRLFKHSSIRIPIQIMFAICGAWIILRTFMVSFQCLPTQYFWDKSIDGHCAINESQFFFSTILTNCVMDLVILALPIIEVCKLKLRFGQKIAVIGLFLIGFIVCLASIFTIVESIKFPTKTREMPRDAAPSLIWGYVEANMAIVSSCVPLLRPVFRAILPHSFLSSYGGSSHPISRTNHGHAIKLSTITRTKEREADESSSTYQLADPEQGLPSSPDFNHGPDTIQTVITSRLRTSRSYSAGEHDIAGMHVRNDMTVEVVEMERAYTMRR